MTDATSSHAVVWLRNPATQSFTSNETPSIADLIIESVTGSGGGGREGGLQVDEDEASFESDDTLLNDDPLEFSSHNGGILRLKRELESPIPGEVIGIQGLSPRDVKPVLRSEGRVATADLDEVAEPVESSTPGELLGPSHQLHMLEAEETDADLDVDDSNEAAVNVCDDCGKTFSNALMLLQHKCSRSVKCPTCAWTGSSEHSLRVHVGWVHKAHRCIDCGVRFAKRCGLVSHARVHARTYSAPAVHARMEAKVALHAKVQAKGERAAQERTRADGEPALCEHCGGCYRTKSFLRRHQLQCRRQGSQGDVKPNSDDKSLIKMAVGKRNEHKDGEEEEADDDEDEVADDKKDIKSRVKPFYCKWCLDSFWYRQCLLRHIERHHHMRNAFKCPTCGASYTNKKALNKHMRVHSVPRPFTCALCHTMFQEREQLMTHLQVHLASKKAGALGMSGVAAISIKKEIGEDRKRRSS